jgi:hypothetical protein
MSKSKGKAGFLVKLGLVVALLGSVAYGVSVLVLTERVPFGFVGVKMTSAGVVPGVLNQGSYWVYGRDRLALIELSEHTETEKLAVLCKDDLNFDLDVKARVQTRRGQDWEALLDKQGPNIVWQTRSVGVLPFKVLYDTYTAPSVRAVTREVVSRYETTDINSHRAEIPKLIRAGLVKKLKGGPMALMSLETSNFDFPKVVTDAVNNAKRREMEIREEKAKNAIATLRKENKLRLDILDAENREKVAVKMKNVRKTEAEAEAVYMQIIGRSVTDKYIQVRQVEATIPFWRAAGKNASMVISDGTTPLMLKK